MSACVFTIAKDSMFGTFSEFTDFSFDLLISFGFLFFFLFYNLFATFVRE